MITCFVSRRKDVNTQEKEREGSDNDNVMQRKGVTKALRKVWKRTQRNYLTTTR